MMATGFAYHEDFLKHLTGPHHPERPARLEAILEGLDQAGLLQRLTRLAVRPVEREWVLAIHSPEYVRRLEAACHDGLPYIDTPDCQICRDSYRVALLAAGAATGAVDAVMSGQVGRAFCAVRPPGHHAEEDAAMGFCLLNHIAIAATYARRRRSVRRVLIFDWDVHHGNGTQDLLWDEGRCLFISSHQMPLYPGTGDPSFTGVGNICNVALPPGSGGETMRAAYEDRVLPALEAFAPDILMISAGFDAHILDPLAGLEWRAADFTWVTERLLEVAQRRCEGRVVSMLEGGYDRQGLSEGVAAHVAALMAA